MVDFPQLLVRAAAVDLAGPHREPLSLQLKASWETIQAEVARPLLATLQADVNRIVGRRPASKIPGLRQSIADPTSLRSVNSREGGSRTQHGISSRAKGRTGNQSKSNRHGTSKSRRVPLTSSQPASAANHRGNIAQTASTADFRPTPEDFPSFGEANARTQKGKQHSAWTSKSSTAFAGVTGHGGRDLRGTNPARSVAISDECPSIKPESVSTSRADLNAFPSERDQSQAVEQSSSSGGDRPSTVVTVSKDVEHQVSRNGRPGGSARRLFLDDTHTNKSKNTVHEEGKLSLQDTANLFCALLEDGYVAPLLPAIHLLLRMLAAEESEDGSLAEELNFVSIINSVTQSKKLAVLILSQQVLQITLALLDTNLPTLIQKHSESRQESAVVVDVHTATKSLQLLQSESLHQTVVEWSVPHISTASQDESNDVSIAAGAQKDKHSEFQREKKLEMHFNAEIKSQKFRTKNRMTWRHWWQDNIKESSKDPSLFSKVICRLLRNPTETLLGDANIDRAKKLKKRMEGCGDGDATNSKVDDHDLILKCIEVVDSFSLNAHLVVHLVKGIDSELQSILASIHAENLNAIYHTHMKTAMRLADALSRITFGPHKLKNQISGNAHHIGGITDPLGCEARIRNATRDGYLMLVLPWIVTFLSGLGDVMIDSEARRQVSINSTLLQNFHDTLECLDLIHMEHMRVVRNFRSKCLDPTKVGEVPELIPEEVQDAEFSAFVVETTGSLLLRINLPHVASSTGSQSTSSEFFCRSSINNSSKIIDNHFRLLAGASIRIFEDLVPFASEIIQMVKDSSENSQHAATYHGTSRPNIFEGAMRRQRHRPEQVEVADSYKLQEVVNMVTQSLIIKGKYNMKRGALSQVADSALDLRKRRANCREGELPVNEKELFEMLWSKVQILARKWADDQAQQVGDTIKLLSPPPERNSQEAEKAVKLAETSTDFARKTLSSWIRVGLKDEVLKTWEAEVQDSTVPMSPARISASHSRSSLGVPSEQMTMEEVLQTCIGLCVSRPVDSAKLVELVVAVSKDDTLRVKTKLSSLQESVRMIKLVINAHNLLPKEDIEKIIQCVLSLWKHLLEGGDSIQSEYDSMLQLVDARWLILILGEKPIALTSVEILMVGSVCAGFIPPTEFEQQCIELLRTVVVPEEESKKLVEFILRCVDQMQRGLCDNPGYSPLYFSRLLATLRRLCDGMESFKTYVDQATEFLREKCGVLFPSEEKTATE